MDLAGRGVEEEHEVDQRPSVVVQHHCWYTNTRHVLFSVHLNRVHGETEGKGLEIRPHYNVRECWGSHNDADAEARPGGKV